MNMEHRHFSLWSFITASMPLFEQRYILDYLPGHIYYRLLEPGQVISVELIRDQLLACGVFAPTPRSNIHVSVNDQVYADTAPWVESFLNPGIQNAQ